MDPAPPAYAAAAAVAGLVPLLLTTHVETAEPACGDVVAAAIERFGDRLLDWHDTLVGTRSPHHDSTQVGPPIEHLPEHGSHGLADALYDGDFPGSPISLELASHELLHVSRRVRQIAESPDLRDDCRPDGVRIADHLERLALACQTHADLLRDEARRLDRVRRERADDSQHVQLETGQVLGRVVRAEHALGRVALDTLPQ
ncbi:hypothetical protein [Leekyejoonella antrihumi]|uniref:DUF4254 domain-containing protein n=1 Tax=Leekyejoonella antrihumi TaxID=1660198 RepID=A0A563DXW4_9MICO|nr:hypothetical protein [Leekyejoonella antrihumi]TWP35118.1 hypothetical protein FGL98_15325 [Leekyejoonella antrihumi]